MPIIFLFGFITMSNNGFAQTSSCVNADFSLGNFTGWIGSTGDGKEKLVNGTSAEVYSNIVNGIVQGVNNSSPSTAGQHTIITNTTLTDPNTGGALKMTPPNGAPSCRLGNDLTYGCESGEKSAARISYTFTVTPSNCIFTYQYAVVLQDPSGSGHTATECPKFTMYITQNGAQIGGTCGIYEVTASSSLPGFSSATPQSTVCDNSTNVIWKNWTTASVDLAQWMNQSITIEFTTYDCIWGAHFGYAYLSCYCGSLNLDQQCSGTSDILTAPSGFSYSWSPGGATTQSVTIPTPVNGTIYTCTCTSASGCSVVLKDTINFTPVVFTANSPTICAGQTATLTATGTGYTYNWSSGLGTASTVNASPTSTTSYTVSASASGGCSNTAQAVVTVNPLPAGSTASTPTNCGQSNGSIQINVTTGTAPFVYLWNTSQTDQLITAIPSGNYSVVVTDANNCVQTITGTVGGSPGPSISGTVQNETCAGYNNGSITIVLGGTVIQPVNYIWSNSATTQNISGLAGGTYTLTITDNVGCVATNSFIVGSSPIITLATSGTDEHCNKNDGSVTVIPSGGNGNFFYTWNNSATTATVNSIPSGTYTISVTDNACSATSSVSIANIAGPSVTIPLLVNDKCNAGNGSATAVAADGTPSYSYLWSPSGQTTSVLQSVHAGTYTISVTDINNCVATSSATLTDTPIPSVSISSTIPANCGFSNGSITAAGIGGTTPYTYSWNNSVTTTTNSQLSSGIYNVSITDANGCTNSISGSIAVLPGPKASCIATPDICYKGVGTATVTPSGGHGAPYTYIWNTGQTDQNVSGLSSGVYSVTVNDGGCTAASNIFVSNIPGPTAYFIASPKTLTVLDGPVFFNDESTGQIVSWDWTLGDQTTASESQFPHYYPEVGEYPITLIVTDNNGCKDTTTDTIKVKDIFTIYIPNSFTPSGDSLNDLFYPQGINWDPNYFEMYIYDRWGNLMFSSLDMKNDKWNGTLNNSGTKDDIVSDVYAYLIRVKELKGPKHQYFGRVTILK